MPTKREREYYRMGFADGKKQSYEEMGYDTDIRQKPLGMTSLVASGQRFKDTTKPQRKRMLNSWQKFVKANSKKKKFRFANGKLKLKSMGIAYRKTAVYKRSKK